tara:strand:- start:2174 stop:3139 length:966 start_codon:yes stop_codon:yes gene_type:complete
MAETIAQDQQSLQQVQQPTSMRGIDPRKLQAFLVQEHYQNKINTVLGENSPEAIDVFKMEGLTWKEKYTEAKARTSPLVDEMDRFLIRGESVKKLDEFYLANQHKMTPGIRAVYRQNRTELGNIEANKKAQKLNLNRQERAKFNLDMENQSYMDKAHSSLKVMVETIADNLEYTQKYTPEMIEEMKIIETELQKDLNYWSVDPETGERNPRGSDEQIQKSLNKISENINFPKKFEFWDENLYGGKGGYDEIDATSDPYAARERWVLQQMKIVEKARDNINKIRVFQPDIERDISPESDAFTTQKPKVNLQNLWNLDGSPQK